MSNEASRAAFEAWYFGDEEADLTDDAPSINDTDAHHKYWMYAAWQASRKAALEAALKIIEDTREYTRFDAVQAIKELME